MRVHSRRVVPVLEEDMVGRFFVWILVLGTAVLRRCEYFRCDQCLEAVTLRLSRE